MVKVQRDFNTGFSLRRNSGCKIASPFVGRDEELRRIAAALKLAAEGQGSIIFLTGQPGIGKTRLAREGLALAKRDDFTVLGGRAYPVGAGLAYAPFLDALAPLLRSLDPARLEGLAGDLPSFGHLFVGLGLPPPEPLNNLSLERTRLFESVSRFLERVAQASPLVLFIDDIHWAEPTTIELLHYLARGLSNQRVLFLATYSSDYMCSSEELQALVAWLERDRLAEEIVIDRLGPESVERIVHGILGEEPQEDLLALLEARAKGTPLFIEVLIAALVDSGSLVRNTSQDGGWSLDAEGAKALPPTARRLILIRLAQLEPRDRHVLDLIAIMGEATSYTILRAASKLDEEMLVESLHHLRVRGLVREGAEGTEVVYRITHPLIQEVVYSELSEVQRRFAHLAAIEALERLRPGDVNRLAHHYCGAGSGARGDRALSALVAAGKRSLNIYANGDAVRNFAAALAMVREGRDKRGNRENLSAPQGVCHCCWRD
ncbi:MAG: AAA family ATPase [Dehalococcoidia bacterium]|nr:AAA family ATPase [Dehalococcoidia bacterium]